jgi:hypothetical protein
MEFPTLVFKKGGAHQRKGGTFSYLGINDAEALEVALAAGWLKTIEELDAPVVKVDEETPPTREELIAKCNELGIKFHHKAGNDKLAALIEEALK